MLAFPLPLPVPVTGLLGIVDEGLHLVHVVHEPCELLEELKHLWVALTAHIDIVQAFLHLAELLSVVVCVPGVVQSML